ncbi:hypothetical protein ACNTMW_12370 [Planosporangium sp. 12N6]|uniref:hypothetical protein n=1 Tax=Planosporangium spinosum TaxID=3402278 RepID=UPI003CF72B82
MPGWEQTESRTGHHDAVQQTESRTGHHDAVRTKTGTSEREGAGTPKSEGGSRACVGTPAPESERLRTGSRAAPRRPAERFDRVVHRTGRFLSHEWTLVCLGALALAVLMTWPAVRHPATTIPADTWDPALQAWQMAWAGHALTHDPVNLWNANAFFPDRLSFAFSDTLFGYFPAGLIGTGPAAALVRYNIMFVLLHALAFVGPYALIRQLGAGRVAAAVAGAACAYAPWRWGQAGHMHVLSHGGIPLAFAMLARGHGFSFTHGFSRDRVRPGWVVAGWSVAAWQISLGFGIGLPFAYVLGALTAVAGGCWLRRAGRGRPVPGRRVLVADGVGLAIFGVVGAFMARPYLEVVAQHPEARRSLHDLRIFSPTLRAFVTAPAQSWLWGDAHARVRDAMVAPAETTLLPGFILIGLAVVGLFFSTWPRRTRLWLLAAAVASAVLAMGTRFPGGGRFTYVPLFEYAPGWDGIRTPGRLVLWTTLLLAVLAAGAVNALVVRSYRLAVRRPSGRPHLGVRLATLLPLLLVLVEGGNRLEHPVMPPQPAALRTATGPLLVLPSDQLTDEQVMLWSTTAFQPMVNGGSGFGPRGQRTARDAMTSFPDRVSVAYLRRIGVKTVIVLKDRIAGTAYAGAASSDAVVSELGITRTDDRDVVVYTIP